MTLGWGLTPGVLPGARVWRWRRRLLVSTRRKRWDGEKERTADFSCTTPAAQNARRTRELVQGSFPFWKSFFENLSPSLGWWFLRRLLWLQGIKCKGKDRFHPRASFKAEKYFVTTFYRHCTGRTHSFRVVGKAWAPWRQGYSTICVLKSQVLYHGCSAQELKRTSLFHVLIILITGLKGVLSGARCKLEGKQWGTFIWRPVRKNGGANDPSALR